MLVVLEYVLTNFMNGTHKHLGVLSDSHSAVDILTLNWKTLVVILSIRLIGWKSKAERHTCCGSRAMHKSWGMK